MRGAVACEHSQAELTGIRALDDGDKRRRCLRGPGAASMAVLAPGKRPLNTTIYRLATKDGVLWATSGVMGGSMQPQGHAQLLSNLVDHDMSSQKAVDHPPPSRGRQPARGRSGKTEVEKLREMGRDVEVGADYAVPTGGAKLIRALKSGVRAYGSDPQRPAQGRLRAGAVKY